MISSYQIVHIGLCLSELHLVHAFTCVPMQESLAPEHGSELLRDPLEQLLDGGGVADEGGGHLQASGRDVTHSGLHVVWDPVEELHEKNLTKSYGLTHHSTKYAEFLF